MRRFPFQWLVKSNVIVNKKSHGKTKNDKQATKKKQKKKHNKQWECVFFALVLDSMKREHKPPFDRNRFSHALGIYVGYATSKWNPQLIELFFLVGIQSVSY